MSMNHTCVANMLLNSSLLSVKTSAGTDSMVNMFREEGSHGGYSE